MSFKQRKGWLCKTNGYWHVQIRRDGKKVQMGEHRLVMEEHLGRRLGRFEYVDHIDGDKLNNDIRNLRVCTPQQNARYYHKISERDVDTVIKRLRQGYTLKRAIDGTSVNSIATASRLRRQHVV